MDDLKTSRAILGEAMQVHETVKFVLPVGMVINHKKCTMQLSVETPLPESILNVPRLDERKFKNLIFEMKKGEDKKESVEKLE